MISQHRNRQRPRTGVVGKVVKSLGFMLAGIAATAIPLQVLLRRELRDAPEDIQAQGWPIRLVQVLFLKYVIRLIDVEGLENLPPGSYLAASNHAYKSGVDGFILGHLLATRVGRVPRIVVTADSRSWAVSAQRWVLHHYGIALLVPDDGAGSRESRRRGLTDIIAGYLRESNKHLVIIFPAGRAKADPAQQLEGWSTGVVVSAQKSGCPIVPIAIGGLPVNWTPETVLLSALHAEGRRPFQIHVRIGKPITPAGEPHEALEELRSAVENLMRGLPGLGPALVESDATLAR